MAVLDRGASYASYPAYAGRDLDDKYDPKTGSTYAHDDRIEAATHLNEWQNEILRHQQLLATGVGVKIYNGTGAGLVAGDIVYVNGWNNANACPTVAKARANAVTTMASAVVTETIADTATGTVQRRWTETAVNTAGKVSGDRFWLSSSAAGAKQDARPTGANWPQVCGRWGRIDASVGTVVWDIETSEERADGPIFATISAGGESGNNIDVSVQLKDLESANLSAESLVEFWLADSATGWETGTAADALSVTVGVAADIPTALKRLRAVTTTAGLATVRVNKAGVQTWYARIAVAGRVLTQAISFT